MNRMPAERPRHDSRMSRRATYLTSVSSVLVAMFAFSTLARTSPTIAAEAEPAIGAATASTTPPIHPELAAPQGSQIQAPESVRSATEFKATLTARYEIEESLVSLEDHPDGGVRGHFSLRGDLTPASALSAQIVQQGPRAIAEIFLAEETASLGIATVDDLRESLFSVTGIGWTGITYHRFVGELQLEHAQVSMSITPEGRIRSVSGFLVPLPAALFEAAARPTISESAAHDIIRNHLVAAGENPNSPYKLKLIATSAAPYVIWNSTGTWIYRIDAFTGEILEKRSGMQSSGAILDRRGMQD